ncbi:putative transcriptional regulator [Methanococcus voltae]|uniref:Transcriptional regulator n=3 Tax=Methanococcus voltae TaxID=2188 RepID=A0ABT2EY16_METVO|nr:helix-turn-helix domain-containing protein [Methanococcus voltae]MBP2173158.1 putative transcriptional regulator [Methanococcus voltae]MBP2202050.1 putative transcriptional regulator [Methanococcus voltae]MCS3922861.1 putative transcriptional regulator [Methanococcus voltae PS]
MTKDLSSVNKELIANLSKLMGSEVKAKIYVYLRMYGESTVDDIAEGTGIYPSTVRESIFEMFNEDHVFRKKMDREGLGKKPYVYSSIDPVDLVKEISVEIEGKLNDLALIDKKISDKKVKAVKPIVSINVK